MFVYHSMVCYHHVCPSSITVNVFFVFTHTVVVAPVLFCASFSKIAKAYSHLHERSVYVEFLENLASSYPPPDGDLDPSSVEGIVFAFLDSIPVIKG